jgi:hypothetical protein
VVKLDRVTGFGLLALGAGMAASALLGPLVLGVIVFRVSDNMENQLVGGEIVSLFVAAPVAVLAGAPWLNGGRLAPVLAMGPALYAVYIYTQYILAPEYDRYEGNNEYFFPFYLALIILGGAVAVRAWAALSDVRLPFPSDSLRRTLAGLLIVLSVVIALAWAASIAEVLSGGVSQEYQEHPTLFWLVRLMDLAFVIPVTFVTGVGLLRRTPWAVRLGYALVGFQTLLVGAIAGIAVVMALRDDPSADPVLLVMTVGITLALAAVYILLVKGLAQTTHRSGGAVTAR